MKNRDVSAKESKSIDVNGQIARPDLYGKIIFLWLIFLALVAGFSLQWKSLDVDKLPILNQVLLALVLIWVVVSVRLIKYGRQVGILGLETPLLNAQSGIRIIVWGIMRSIEYPTDVQAKQFPGNPEQIFKGDDKDPLPSNKLMFRPIRLTTGKPDKNAVGILDIQASVEILFFLRISISDALRFHIKYGTIDGFWDQIRSIAQAILTEEFSQAAGLGHLIENLPKIMNSLQKRFADEAAQGGVRVHSSGLDSPDVSKRLAEALRDLGVSRSQAEQAKIKIIAEGKGRASAERDFINASSEALRNADESAKSAYVGSKILNEKTVILGSDGIAQAVGLLKIIRQRESEK